MTQTSGLVLIVDDDEALSENLAEIVQELASRRSSPAIARARWRRRPRATSTSR